MGIDAGSAHSLRARRGYMASRHCALVTRLPNLPLTAGSFEPRSFRDGGLYLLYRSAGAVADVVEIWMTLSPAFSGYRVMRQRQAFATGQSIERTERIERSRVF